MLMDAETLLTPTVPTIGRQLALPLGPPEPPNPRGLPGTLGAIRPQRVWASLPLTVRSQVRSTYRRICQELAHDAARRPGEDHRLAPRTSSLRLRAPVD